MMRRGEGGGEAGWLSSARALPSVGIFRIPAPHEIDPAFADALARARKADPPWKTAKSTRPTDTGIWTMTLKVQGGCAS